MRFAKVLLDERRDVCDFVLFVRTVLMRFNTVPASLPLSYLSPDISSHSVGLLDVHDKLGLGAVAAK